LKRLNIFCKAGCALLFRLVGYYQNRVSQF
jgi:hypothetical protein